MIHICHKDQDYWVDETSVQSINTGIIENSSDKFFIEINLISKVLVYYFESKEKLNYFMDKYFKDMLDEQ